MFLWQGIINIEKYIINKFKIILEPMSRRSINDSVTQGTFLVASTKMGTIFVECTQINCVYRNSWLNNVFYIRKQNVNTQWRNRIWIKIFRKIHVRVVLWLSDVFRRTWVYTFYGKAPSTLGEENMSLEVFPFHKFVLVKKKEQNFCNTIATIIERCNETFEDITMQ